MKVAITGGAGFVGSHIADQLLARGDEVLVIDNFSTGRRDNLEPHDNLTLIEGTISCAKTVQDAFEAFKPECVVHCAASYKDPHAWTEDSDTNVKGTANIVQAAEAVNVKRVVYFQTALCYGLKPLEQPITLSHPILPDGSSYAISKTAGEQYIRLSGLDYVSLRLANVYGPRNVSGPLPTFFHRLTEGKPCFVMDTRRDFVYVDDLVQVAIKAIDGTGKGEYHVSSGSDVSIKELFDATLAAMNVVLEEEVEVRPRTPDDVYSILLDPSKTESDFNWKANTTLEYGTKQAIEYYKQYGITATYTHLKQLNDQPAEKAA